MPWAIESWIQKGGAAVVTLLSLAACDAAPIESPVAADDQIVRGEAAARRLGCGACHDMPGVNWPKGKVGPPLEHFGERALIAGAVPNEPALLAKFLRDAPAIVPTSAMPAIPMSDTDADDIAAWLGSLRE